MNIINVHQKLWYYLFGCISNIHKYDWKMPHISATYVPSHVSSCYCNVVLVMIQLLLLCVIEILYQIQETDCGQSIICVILVEPHGNIMISIIMIAVPSLLFWSILLCVLPYAAIIHHILVELLRFAIQLQSEIVPHFLYFCVICEKKIEVVIVFLS